MDFCFKVTHHTDKIGPQTTFFAFVGNSFNGISLIPEALKRGACQVVVDHKSILSQEIIDLCKKHNAKIIFSNSLRQDFAEYAAKAYDNPSHKLIIIGITGTKGKTTTTLLCAQLLKAEGHKVAILSSVYNSIDTITYDTNLTTQHADYLQAFLNECIEKKVTHVVMEVSAQAVSLKRTHGILFNTLIFTNFSHEHGEFYQTQELYFKAKCELFKQLKAGGTIIINNDDNRLKNYNFISPANPTASIITFSSHQGDYLWKTTDSQFHYISGEIQCDGKKYIFSSSAFCGTHNIENITAAFAATRMYCPSLSFNNKLQDALAHFQGAPGRCKRYTTCTGIDVCIDMAHTPSSFESTLSTLKQFTHNLIVVFGCGGDKDKEKRPMLTELALKYGDYVFITADNPRTEKFEDICNDMLATTSSFEKISIIEDRKIAILQALEKATAGSIVVCLGKGNETYQIYGKTKIPFSEIEIIKQTHGIIEK